MINANEIRIGNWVECTLIGKVQITQEDIGSWPALAGWPIPLTPEILLKAGFDKDYKIKLTRRGYYLEWDCSIRFWMCDGNDEMVYEFENITSLHQLQNLYFALTEKELSINLTEGTK